ncbi:hypothetical protein DQ04_03031040, partial [Trypanosoma grayi]|uniref:hypothetical protein n=1 Tax=Trypanosoma grayi TaxID=71804 RepID=UPI0004F402E0
MSITGVLPETHWQAPSKTKYCQYQDCGASFGIFSSKTNCRRCGIVICSKCVRTCDSITGHYYNKPQPVCPRCLEFIERQKEKMKRTLAQQAPSIATRNNTDAFTAETVSSHEAAAQAREQIQRLEEELAAERHTHKEIQAKQANTIEQYIIQREKNLLELDGLRVTIAQLTNDKNNTAANESDSHGIKEVAQINPEKHLLQTKPKELFSQLQDSEEARARAQSELLELQAQLHQLSEQMRASSTELQSRLGELTAERDELRDSSAELQGRLGELTAERDELRERIRASSTELQGRLGELTAERDELRANSTELQGRLGELTLRANSTELQGRLGELTAERDELRASSTELQGRLGELTVERDELRASSAELQGRLGELTAERDDLRERMRASSTELQ